MRERRFLSITFCLITLLGGSAVYSIIQPPNQAEKSSSSREPASAIAEVRKNPSSRKGITSKSVILDFSCQQKNLSQEVDGNLLRLRGSHCFQENWKDFKLTNETNGFTASIIFLKNKNFTTDFIDLKEGVNQLQIQATNEKGEVVLQKLSVRRLPATEETE